MNINNLLASGIIVVANVAASNAGQVIITAGGVIVASLPSLNVGLGDLILVGNRMRSDKGVTRGLTVAQLLQTAGTATIEFYKILGTDSVQLTQEANDSDELAGYALVEITVAGTLTLSMQGISFGSNGTVPVQAGKINAINLRGS